MTLPDKKLLYDWNGANESIFKFVNSIREDSYDMVMILITRFADHHNFLYFILGTFIWVMGSYILKKIRSKGGTNTFLAQWLGVMLVLTASYTGGGWLVKNIKEEMAYPRPYIEIGSQDVHVLDPAKNSDDDHHSFPSGHEFFITIMVIGLWPVLSVGLRWFGVVLIPLVGWSRMSLGMHFPADVLGGFFIGLIMAYALQVIIYRILYAMHIRC